MQQHSAYKKILEDKLDEDITADERLRVRVEQVRMLYLVSPYLVVGSSFVGAVLGVMQWHIIAHETIVIWFACLMLSTVFRSMALYKFSSNALNIYTTYDWEKWYMISVLLLSFAWGSAGIFLLPSLHFEGQVLTTFTLMLVVGVLSARPVLLRKSFFIFLLCVMIPLITHLAFLGTEIGLKLAVLCIIYTGYLSLYVNKSYKINMRHILFQVRYLEHEGLMQVSQHLSKKTAEILKMVAIGEPAQKIYDEILRLYESCYDGLRCSILTLHGKHLFHNSAPSLPQDYCDAINGVEIGPNIGSCGTAAYVGERVLVEDISSDVKWQAFKDIALPHGMRSCWSEPVLDAKGKVLGTLAMYHDEPGLPSEQELHDLEAAAQLVSIVMERERREDSLRTLSQAIEQASEGIMISDSAGVIEYINSAFTQLTGYEAGEILGKPLEVLNKSKQTEALYEKLWSTVSHGGFWSATVSDQRKDGREYLAMMSVAPIFDGENISHYVTIKKDITEQEALEDQLRQAQKMEAVGTLVGGIAHDFNNILAGMTGNLYLAKRRSQSLPNVVKGIENIEQLAVRGADLVQRLMTFARKDRVNMQKMKLEPVLMEAFQLLRTSIPANIDLHQNMTGRTLYIRGDSTQLHQVLMNLVNNAHDAIAGKSNPMIHIGLEAFYPDVDFMEAHPYFQPVYYAHLSVEDNGCGISENQVEHLFEPFFTTKEVGKGTGLGLSMVFGAVKRHEGFIEVESVEGKGATFHVYLPLIDVEDDICAPLLQQSLPFYAENHEVILLVDDDAFVLEMARDVLEDLGYQVLEARNGLEAVHVFTENQEQISLVITDVVMPKLSGIKAAEHIRKLRPDMKIIFATAYDKSATLPSEVLASGRTILSKPYDIELLSQMIRKELDGQY